MKRRLIVRPEAEADISEAADWYEQQRHGLGFEFTAAIRKAIQEATTNPLGHSLMRRVPQVRRIMVDRFPYRVFYIVRRAAIVVFAVPHNRRHERQWQTRVD